MKKEVYTACPVRLFPCSYVNFGGSNHSNYKINQIFKKFELKLNHGSRIFPKNSKLKKSSNG